MPKFLGFDNLFDILLKISCIMVKEDFYEEV